MHRIGGIAFRALPDPVIGPRRSDRLWVLGLVEEWNGVITSPLAFLKV
jgi:hypothetical protein